ncbi:MAG: NUDIX hydrolase [Patescibacteria group bacterium]
MVKQYRTLASKVVFNNRWVQLKIDSLELDKGQSYDYVYLTRHHNGVVAIAYFEKADQLMMVRQYRHPVGEHLWGFPAGGQEKGQAPRQTARKELAEEAGLVAGRLIDLGHNIIDPGIVSNRGRIFLTLDPTVDESKKVETASEKIICQRFTLEEVDQMVAKGQIRDGWTLSALYLFKLWQKGSR